MLHSLRQDALDLAYPILKCAGKIHAPWTRKQLKERYVHHLQNNVLKPGDLLLTTKYGEFTNLMIQGRFKHVGVFAGFDVDRMVVEAIDPRVQYSGLFDFVMSKDELVVVRSIHTNGKTAAFHAGEMVGLPYDYDFLIPDERKPNRAFYCAEVGYYAHKRALSTWMFRPRPIWGVPTINPDDFLQAKKYFEVVWDSRHHE